MCVAIGCGGHKSYSQVHWVYECCVEQDPEGERPPRDPHSHQTEEEEGEGDDVDRVVPTFRSHPRIIKVSSEIIQPCQVGQLRILYLRHVWTRQGARERERERERRPL